MATKTWKFTPAGGGDTLDFNAMRAADGTYGSGTNVPAVAVIDGEVLTLNTDGTVGPAIPADDGRKFRVLPGVLDVEITS